MFSMEATLSWVDDHKEKCKRESRFLRMAYIQENFKNNFHGEHEMSK